jgi:hypothetical protein
MISFSMPGFIHQRCSETLQFMTNEINITGLHSAEGHCSLQYSQLNSTSFEISSSIDAFFGTSFCSHTVSTNRYPLKTINIAPTCGLFGSQHRPEDNMAASDSTAGNTPSTDTDLGPPLNQFHSHLG